MTRPVLWRIGPALLALTGLLVLAACGARDGAGQLRNEPGGSDEPGPADGTRYQVVATVLESSEHGPQLCLGMLDSYPPQCGGADVVGWDWAGLDAESANGTTWGEYLLVGTWDGQRFTVTEPPRPPESAGPGADPDTMNQTPCPEPAGGWRPADPDKATDQALDAALARAATADDYAGGWLDQSYLDELGLEPNDPAVEGEANDPTRLVLNVMFTGDGAQLADREQWLREVWGGALCVSAAERTEDELREVQERLHADFPDEILGSGVDLVGNVVEAQVYVATAELQHQIDERYGAGVVVLDGWLQPTN